MYSSILGQIHTTADRDTLLEGLEALLANLYSKKAESESLEIPPELEREYQAASDKKEFLKALTRELSNLKTLRITTSLRLNRGILENISKWIKTNVDPNLILEIEVDPSIIGGMVIEYKGIYKDYSLSRRLDDIFGSPRKWKTLLST